MHIQNVKIQNFKSIEDLDVPLNGKSVYLIGDNGVGKSSFIQAIFTALTGKELPSEPLRTGAKDGLIEITVDGNDEQPAFIVSVEFSEKNQKGKLSVRPADGGRAYGSPRDLLNSFVGNITFDPFADLIDLTMDKKVKKLESLLGVNFEKLNAEFKEIYDDRTAINKEIKEKKGWLANQPVKDHEIKLFSEKRDLSEVQKKIQEAGQHNAEIERLKNGVQTLRGDHERKLQAVEGIDKEILELEEKLRLKRESRKAEQEEADKLALRVKDGDAMVAKMVPVDMTEMNKTFEDAVNFNKKCEEVLRIKEKFEEVELKEKQAEQYTKRLKEIKEEKLKILGTKKMPVAGLTLDDDMLLLDGLPFEREQIPMSKLIMAGVNIMMAYDQKIKIARIRDASLLSSANRKEIIHECNELDYQCFIEIVDESYEQLTINFIEG